MLASDAIHMTSSSVAGPPAEFSLSHALSSSKDRLPELFLSHLASVSAIKSPFASCMRATSLRLAAWLDRLMLLSSSSVVAALLIFFLGFSAAAAAAGLGDTALAAPTTASASAAASAEGSSRENHKPSAFFSSGLVMTPLPSWSAFVKTQSTSASSGVTPSLRSVRRLVSWGRSRESLWSVSYFAKVASISSLLSLYAIQTSTAATKSSGSTDASKRSSFFLKVPTLIFSFWAMT
mmetsp:Transcript_31761/g.61999  ORF Transcript_31761/g.61999 Transcript_31761/m.61999 type:complete len:236 (-) Transcript_31761:1075-1782(-)